MADPAESSDNSSPAMSPNKDNEKPGTSRNSKEGERVRKSSRIKQHAKFEKHMSMFVMQSRKGERRGRSSGSSSEEEEPPKKVTKKSEKPEKKVVPRPGRPKDKSPKKLSEVKKELTSSSASSSSEEEEMDPNDTEFSLSMVQLRRVGENPPRSDKSAVPLNARGMPQRIRKKNRLFFDENVVNTPIVKNKHKKTGVTEKKAIVRNKTKNDRKEEEPVKPPTPVDDSKEANSMRQKIGMKLRNLLKLPKAQRWVFNEWFYSNIDHVLFMGNNDFVLCLKDHLPNLKTYNLTRAEWGFIRRLFGKPRRCSQDFFRQERKTLERKRNIIRMIQQRKIKDASQCRDLPDRIPLQLSVNSRVTAKLRRPQSGLFTGKVDAVDPSNHTYRITFDRAGLGTHSIPDYEVLLHGEPDMVSVSVMHRRYLTSKTAHPKPARSHQPKEHWVDNIRNGMFPKGFYEMMVRICKILKEKKGKVVTLSSMNSEAEKMMSLGEEYPIEFQRRYAAIIVDLEGINISLKRYLTAVQKYCHEIAPDVCATTMLAPSFIREKSLTEAKDVVDAYFKEKPPLCNTELINLVIELIALVIQVQNLSKYRATVQERQVLRQSITKIKTMISPKNLIRFQNYVEVHIRYIEATLGEGSHLYPLVATSK